MFERFVKIISFAITASGVMLFAHAAAAAPTEINAEDIPQQLTGINDSILELGDEVNSLGDIDGDGYEDFGFGSYNMTQSRNEARIVYGSSEPTDFSNVDVTDLPAFTGAVSVALSTGLRIVGAGDVNGDGYDDFLVSDVPADSVAGAVYLVYGSATRFSGEQTAASAGVKFSGESAGDYAGVGTGPAGDVNGDGYDDFLVGAFFQDTRTGAAYLYYGKATTYNPETLGTTGIKFTGEGTNNRFGTSSAGGGDLNNDGYDDFVISASQIGTYAGAIYVFYGQSSSLTGGVADTKADAKISGAETYDNIGISLSIADVNGDNYDDLISGSIEQSTLDVIDPYAFIFYGSSSELTDTTAASADAKFTVSDAGNSVTLILFSVGDVNNDGYTDVALGVDEKVIDAAETGAVYLFFGSASGFSASETHDTADFVFEGESANDNFGQNFTALDINGDNWSDLVMLGSGVEDDDSVQVGRLYLAFVYVDADQDGVPGNEGLVNGADTNDTIKNNGVEIDGNGISDDGDAEIDEVNTIAENGAHPEYSTYDVTDSSQYDNAVVSVKEKKRGRINVTFADNSVYRYEVFPAYTKTKKTKAKRFRETGRHLVLHPHGRKLALVNVLTGSVLDTQKITNVKYDASSYKILKYHGKYHAVVTTKKGDDKNKLTLVRIKPNDGNLIKKDSDVYYHSKVKPRKTSKNKKTVRLRQKNGTVLRVYNVTSNFKLSPQ